MKYLKICALFTVVCAFADPYENEGYYRNSSQANSQSHNDAHLEYAMITPNASPVVREGVDVFAFADYLYWTARQDNLAFAQSGVTLSNNASSFTSTTGEASATTMPGKLYYVDPKFDSGFKGGIGIDMGHDGWDLMATYTWFRTHQSAKLLGNAGALIGKKIIQTLDFTEIANFDTGSFYGETRSSWTLHFNNVDWNLGRNFFISPYLTLRPHIGVKGTWQKQRWNTKYEDITDTETIDSTTTTTTGLYRVRYNQKYWGVGVRGGLESCYYFTQNFGVYGEFSLATLWGQFVVKRTDDLEQTEVTGNTTTVTPLSLVTNFQDRFHSINGVFELEIGIRYDVWYADNNYRIRFQAGWENQLWLDQGKFRSIGAPTAIASNLTFQGVNARLRVDF